MTRRVFERSWWTTLDPGPSTGGQRPGQRVLTIDRSDIRGSSARTAIMIVIRRELSRTRRADSAVKACRIEAHKDSPLPCATPAADRWCLYRAHRMARHTSGSAARLPELRTFDLTADRLDKTQPLTPDCRGHLLLPPSCHAPARSGNVL